MNKYIREYRHDKMLMYIMIFFFWCIIFVKDYLSFIKLLLFVKFNFKWTLNNGKGIQNVKL